MVGYDSVPGTGEIDRKCEILRKPLGFLFIRRTNCLLHIQNQAIRIGGSDIDVTISIDDLDLRTRRGYNFVMFIEAEIVTCDIPQIDFFDLEHIRKIGTNICCCSQRASRKNNEQE